MEVADEGRTVIASNAKTYWGWFVWRKATPSDEARLEAMDELSATCRIKKIAVPVESAGRAAIMCDRYILGTSYSLNYSFESESRVAEGVEELDAQVFAGIDRWRCKK